MVQSTGYVNGRLADTDLTRGGDLGGPLPGGGPRGSVQRFLTGMLLGVLAGLVLLAGGALAWQRHYVGRVVPGIWVSGVPLQGLTAAQAEAALRQAWDQVGPRHLTLRDGDRQWVLPLDTLGIGWDLPATVGAAMAVGHSDSFWETWRIRLCGLQRGVAVPPLWTLDEARCNLALRRLAAEIDQPPRSATLELGGTSPQSEPAVHGRELDVDATREKLRQALATGLPPALDLEIRSLVPTVVDGEAARQRAEQLLTHQPVVTFDEGGTRHAWSLSRQTVAAGLRSRQEVGSDGLTRWVIDFDPAPIAAWLANIAQQIDRPAIEGRVAVNLGTMRASIAVPSQTGRRVNTAEALSRILAALEDGSSTVELPVDIERPYVSAEEVARWGTFTLLSEGVSYFRGSDPGRKQNIVVGSSRFDGVVVPPGGTFSFNQYIG
ncbi:MAG: peptidoglycan binding domain-containing protein, partial [Anaerolineae bacterium]|nr:peptidoglycan binding domain-containing protein [Anaerolineae bacterium]